MFFAVLNWTLDSRGLCSIFHNGRTSLRRVCGRSLENMGSRICKNAENFDWSQGKHPMRGFPPLWRFPRFGLLRQWNQGGYIKLFMKLRWIGTQMRTFVFCLQLWDVRKKGCIFGYKGHNGTVNSLKFSPDGQWIASGGDDNFVKVINDEKAKKKKKKILVLLEKFPSPYA